MTSPDPKLYDQARGLVLAHQKVSTAWLQRQLGLGYNATALMVDKMEREGLVSAPDGQGRRTVMQETHPALEQLAQQLADRGATITHADNGTPTINIPIGPGHNRRGIDTSPDASATDDRLRLLIERVERLEEEKRGIADDIKDVYAEAKAVGYDTAIMKKVVALRRMKPDDRRAMEMLLDTYKAALGLG